MIAEGDQSAHAVESALEKVEAAGSIEVVPDVVLAAPDELDRRPRALRDPGGLGHEVAAQAPSESAAHPRHVDRDVPLGDPERRPDQSRARSGDLRRRPEHDLAVRIMRGAVLRLETDVGEERIGVGRLHDLCGALKRRCDIAVAAQNRRRRFAGKPGRFLGKELAALSRSRALVPGNLELPTGAACGPPARGDDRDPVADALRDAARVGLARADDKGVADAGQRLDGVGVRARHRAAEDRALLEDGVEHAGHDDIDAEKRLTGYDPGVVDAGRRLADDPEALRVLELHAGEIRSRQRGGFRGQLAIAKRTPALLMINNARFGIAFGRRHVPALRGRGHEHLPPGGADAAQRIVVERRRHASARELLPVLGLVERRLFDPHVLPFDVEFLGDHHRQHRLDALANLGILRHDRYDAVGRDVYESVERRGFACVGQLRRRGIRKRRQHRLQQQSTARCSARLQE